ncbi:hypothetical protein Mhypo_01367 [Meiothermus hypogaeus]|uniref:Uncharacterized protein n=1 Tax=Meiothermus hypogaeus TaxID=884155 RepID=A0ABX9MMU2_9DEIN|nr:hypothetical protein Mhypo_01367 [Meiothermus hypogaeus]
MRKRDLASTSGVSANRERGGVLEVGKGMLTAWLAGFQPVCWVMPLCPLAVVPGHTGFKKTVYKTKNTRGCLFES